MNDLIQTGGSAVTMTSLDLVQFINNQREAGAAELAHSDFLKKVPQVLGGDAGKFSSVYLGGNGQERPCYVFPKREACLMAMSYSYDLQAKVFDRMTDLEAEAAPVIDPMKVLNDPVSMRTLLLGYSEKVIALEAENAAMAPKVQAFDRIATSDGSMCLTDAAKTLQVQPRKFTQLLQEQHWTYRRPMGTGWLAYQDKIQQGLMEHKVTTGEKGDGTEWTSTQPRITAKGLTKLASIVQQGGLH